MKAPVLNRPMLLEAPVRVPDDAGGFDVTWQTLGTLWAQVVPGRGRERLEGALPRTEVPVQIILRGAPLGADRRPDAGQRLRDGARVYALLAVTEHDIDGRYLICQALQEGAA